MNYTDEIKSFVDASMAAAILQTQGHGVWGIDRADEWNVDLDIGRISFGFQDGKVVTGSMQVIGTFDPETQTFLWGWDHPSVPPELASDARLVREYAEDHGVAPWLMRQVSCSERDAWEFTAVAARLAAANGTYRGDTGGALVFMTFGTLTIDGGRK